MYKLDLTLRRTFCFYLPLIIISLFFLLLNGCSTVSRKDGPPSFPVDETKVPNAVPCCERLSKSGNKTYRVFGRNYYVMRSSKNYKAVGIASWYGTKFHSRHTSSGEPYNMLAMTAAHKSLPLPTYVEVTNLRNQRQVIVKVNDRGPFEANRIIDLSYVAAKKLGMVGHGTALVCVKAIDPVEYAHRHDPYYRSRQSQYAHNQNQIRFKKKSRYADLNHYASNNHTASNNYSESNDYSRANNNGQAPHHFLANENSGLYLQVGAFKNRLYAERLRHKLQGVISSPINIASNNKVFKVQIGPFKDASTAGHVSKKLKTIGLSSRKTYTPDLQDV